MFFKEPLERHGIQTREHSPSRPLRREMALSRYLSPLGWEHINLTGDYVWRQNRKINEGQFRPLQTRGNP